jgi:hypothetical protein
LSGFIHKADAEFVSLHFAVVSVGGGYELIGSFER